MRPRTRYVILAVLLLFMVIGSGCIVNVREKGHHGRFFLSIRTHGNTTVVKNWTAVRVNITSGFILEGNRSVNTDKQFTAILLETGNDVANMSAFRLGRNVYLIPPYMFSGEYKAGEEYASLNARIKNGSYAFVEVTYQGTPERGIGLSLSFTVKKLNNGDYKVELIGAGSTSINAFGKKYKVVALPVGGLLDFVGIPSERYLGNWTYILPPTDRYRKNGVTTTIGYPVAEIYIEYDGYRAFLGKVYFPYEKINGEG